MLQKAGPAPNKGMNFIRKRSLVSGVLSFLNCAKIKDLQKNVTGLLQGRTWTGVHINGHVILQLNSAVSHRRTLSVRSVLLWRCKNKACLHTGA